MQEFVTIPTYLIRELPQDKLCALLDILSMVDENGEVKYSEREFMSRWGWSNTKVRNFVSILENKSILKVEKKQEKSKILLINKGFEPTDKSEKKAEKKQEKSKNFQVSIGTKEAIQQITDSWNALSDYGIEPIPILGISSVQYQNIKTLAQEYGVEDILNAIERIKASDFLQGRSEQGWRITFGWFLRKENYEKVRGGEYDGIRESTRDAYMDAIKNRVNIVDTWMES